MLILFTLGTILKFTIYAKIDLMQLIKGMLAGAANVFVIWIFIDKSLRGSRSKFSTLLFALGKVVLIICIVVLLARGSTEDVVIAIVGFLSFIPAALLGSIRQKE